MKLTVSEEILDEAFRAHEEKEFRNREQRVRRQAKSFGFLLQKSAGAEGYRLFDARRNLVVLGKEFDASLDIIEIVLRKN